MPDRATRRPDGPPASAARRTRVLVIVGLFVVAVVSSALVGWRFARESTPVTGPILLISIDPLRTDRLSFYGGRTATPNLDRLAASGTVFTHAYSHAAASLPAHTSLLTGQLPIDHGVRDNVGFALGDGAATLASRLADRGFVTGAAVSTFLLRAETGLDRGFAHYDAARPAVASDALVPPIERDNAATARAAAAWLDEQDSERLFYTMQLNGTAVALDSGDGGAAVTDRDAVAIGAADAAVGTVLDALRRKGWYDEALVVVTSAYGGAAAVAGDPGRDFTLDMAATRVPLVVKMPGAAEPLRVDTPLQHIDLTPTVLDLVRAPGSSSLRGRSFRGLLEGDDDGPADVPHYAEAMSGALRFGWAELAEPADGTFRSSVATLVPATASDSDRDALALLGEVAPTLLPVSNATTERPDPRTMGALLAAYRAAARHDAARAFAAAIAEYHRVVEASPADANAWHRLGLAAARLGRGDEALGAFARVDALRPGQVEAAIEAAKVEIEAGQLEQAWVRLTAALETLAPTAPPRGRAAAHDLLAAIAATRKRPDEARAQAALAEKAAPDVPFAAFVEARLAHDQDESEAALAGFDAVVKALDGRPAPLDGLHWYRGDCLARLDRHPEALEAFERAIAEAPFDVRAYTSLATLQRASNRRDDAVATVERLVRAVPTPSGYATAARLWTLLGERARAAELRAAARERFAGEPGLRPSAR